MGGKFFKKNNKFIIIVLVLLILGIISFVSYKNSSKSIILTPLIKKEPFQQEKEVRDVPKSEPLKSEEVDKISDDLLESLEKFYNSYKDYTNFISKDGRLFDLGINRFIILEDLDFSKIDKKDFSNFEVIFIKKASLKNLSSKIIPKEDDFSPGFKINVDEGFLYILEGGDKFLLKKQESELLDKIYSCDYSRIEFYRKNVPQDKKILNLLKKQESYSGDYDVRDMRRTEKFCSVTYSQKDKETDIKQKIFVKNKGSWELLLENIENFSEPFLAINKANPNINLDLVPNYNLSLFKDSLNNKYDFLQNSMVKEGYLTEEDNIPVFICGVERYVYLEFRNNKKFVASKVESDFWVIYPVSSYEEALIVLLSINEDAPVFIVRNFMS